MDTTTLGVITNAIRTSPDNQNPYVRDINLDDDELDACEDDQSGNGLESFGWRVRVDGVCWVHTHPDNYGVYE